MKKKTLGAALLALLIGSICLFAGCATTVRLPFDDQIKEDGSFNENLFYRNDAEILAPDPQVLRITDPESTEYGYYYLYATNGMTVYRSKDLSNWENVSKIVGYPAYTFGENDFCEWTYSTLWAPECIYDAESKMYYLYFSMEPRLGDTSVFDMTLMCCKSENPYGPFVNVRSGEGAMKYKNYFFDFEQLVPLLIERYPDRFPDGIDYVASLDPSPWVDPASGKKYLYFSIDNYGLLQKDSCIFGMEMEDWETPIYDTVTRLTRCNYTKVEGGVRNDCETQHNTINEGPFMYAKKHDDGTYTYYLTYSCNDYTNKNYVMCQAIGSSPLDPDFEKLQPEDGGILLGTDNQQWDHLSGPGHHSFIVVDEKIYCLYHEHMDVTVGGGNRAISLAEVKFTTNGKGQEVMYVNGPTKSLMLRPEFINEYKNIAQDAKIESSDKQDASVLNDGLLSLYSYIDYVKEFSTKEKKVTFTLTFEEYREVTGVMVYNSKNYSEAFDKISEIKFYFQSGGGDCVGVVNDVAFDWNNYRIENADAMRPGGAAIALINPIKVNKIEITIELSKDREIGQDDEGYFLYPDTIALSEIMVIGK